MYLVVIGWLYVAAMLSAAEATHSNGSILGAIFTFFLYGLAPVALLLYLTKNWGKKSNSPPHTAEPSAPSAAPDGTSHATGGTEATGIAAVRKEP